MAGYDPGAIEPKWQRYWLQHKTFRSENGGDKPKFYVLDMFPYPSGEGLHVGHPEGYTASDIIARYKRMRGFNVLHPMGWDAFGLRAERYARVTGQHPRATTQKNIGVFRGQLQRLGFSYDWDREVDTTDPAYYKWTQWIFLKLLEKGLAYEAEIAVNWCEELGTVLSNEEVINGRSEVGDFPVVRKPMRQWILKITDYAERLLADLDDLDWSESIKQMQRNWIGKSTGAEVDFYIGDDADAWRAATAKSGYPEQAGDDVIRVYTTRPDTLFGATYMVLAPEHPLVQRLTTPGQTAAVEAYCEEAARKSDLDRTDLAKDKTGVFTGSYAVNPVNNERVPVWVADYVLVTYGTGAIMAVPAHDERDFEFAKQFDLTIRCILDPDLASATRTDIVGYGDMPTDAAKQQELRQAVLAGDACWSDDGTLCNSACEDLGISIDGLNVPEAIAKTSAWLAAHGVGTAAVNYKLRDWIFSRQHYWGEPFPVLHLQDGTTKPLRPEQLPLELPDIEDWKHVGGAATPLATVESWVNATDPDTGQPASHEINTMPQWAGSCWYYLRFTDPTNDQAPWDAESEKYWMPVDLYIGGAEHAVLHLLYARFWHKVLYDLGCVSTPEPFQKLVNQGMVLGLSYKTAEGRIVPNKNVEFRDGKPFWTETGEELEEFTAKMSKTLGNVVNPDDVVQEYGADSLRLYEMFMGPLESVKPWNTRGVEGVNRFLGRVWRMIVGSDGELHAAITDDPPEGEAARVLHKTVKAVTDDLEDMAFNTAISRMMEFVNFFTGQPARPREAMEAFVLLLSPFAPHIGEELWHRLRQAGTLARFPWPTYDEALTRDETAEVAVQINGKVRSHVTVSADADAKALEQAALADPRIVELTADKTVRKVIAIPGRLVNIVVGK